MNCETIYSKVILENYVMVRAMQKKIYLALFMLTKHSLFYVIEKERKTTERDIF